MKELIKAAVMAYVDKELAKVKELTPELRAFIRTAIVDYIESKF